MFFFLVKILLTYAAFRMTLRGKGFCCRMPSPTLPISVQPRVMSSCLHKVNVKVGPRMTSYIGKVLDIDDT